MTVQTPPYVQQGQTHTAALFRQSLGASLGLPLGSVFAGGIQATTGGGAHGVCRPGDLVVTQDTGSNMNSKVAAGFGFVTGTENASQGTYGGYNDGAILLTHSASDPTNPRKDLIVMRVRDAFYSGVSTDVSVVIVTGTAAASPLDPTVPADSLVLARVLIPATTTAVVNANITDLRTVAGGMGAIRVVTSTTRPTGSSLYNGLHCYETDTGNTIFYNGSIWQYARAKGTYTPTLSGLVLGTGGTNTANWYWDGVNLDVIGAIAFGSSGQTFPGSAITFSLPSAFDATGILNTFHPVGRAYMTVAGTAYEGPVTVNSGTTMRWLATSINAAAAGTDYLKPVATSTTIPNTWASGNTIFYSIRLPAAHTA